LAQGLTCPTGLVWLRAGAISAPARVRMCDTNQLLSNLFTFNLITSFVKDDLAAVIGAGCSSSQLYNTHVVFIRCARDSFLTLRVKGLRSVEYTLQDLHDSRVRDRETLRELQLSAAEQLRAEQDVLSLRTQIRSIQGVREKRQRELTRGSIGCENHGATRANQRYPGE
jgi:hypothetical protein